MAGQRPLKPLILVRIQVGHQIKHSRLASFLFDAWHADENILVRTAKFAKQTWVVPVG